MRKIQDIKLRFFKFVIKECDEKCWYWKGAKNPQGYGRFCLPNNKRVYAHRYSFELVNGSIPEKMSICHTCDNPSCVNPNHLWLGTAKDNARDMVNKNRHKKIGRYIGRKGRKVNTINYQRGSQRPAAKLTEKSVRKIKLMLNEGCKVSQIVKKYKVSQQLISTIKNGKSWKHVII